MNAEGGVVTQPIPLVVDLDGTLVRTDTLHESLIGLLAAAPATLLRLPRWLAGGRAAFKAQVAGRHMPDAVSLPYDESVLELISAARAEGRPVVLVSGADRRIVEAVARHLGIFDLVAGSGPGTGNLSGHGKAEWLSRRFGRQRFDYVGDSRADLPVWRLARRAYATGSARRIARLAAQAQRELTPVADGLRPGAGRALLRAMRPHQWAKNALVLLPAFAAHDARTLPAALLGAAAFSVAASSVYLVNDMLDLAADRAHPRKRERPFAAGRLRLDTGGVAAVLLLLFAALLSIPLPEEFRVVLAAYLGLTFAYSIRLKRKLLVDIIALAALYTIRILAGAAATGIALSPWLLAFSMFVFFSLAAVKRLAELVDLQARGIPVMAGRGYRAEDAEVMRSMAVASGQAAVVVFALYINSENTAALYRRPELLWLICPVLLFWLGRMVMMTQRGFMTDDPVVFALRDRNSLGAIALILAITVAAAVGWPA